ncbi:hypothetical protein ACFQ1E_11745 [Sphingomonas canadensis]|uniref:YtxH domain-containing protein n=1 Tax=Sphingomonas canadensis TaxID=1219257 RepID=A0ABW3H8D1_9SPHN|nr:hypothetical protein [Sphingomonas canadensis]MCW3836853.1 hypothetical protein [Sphingomonas canadensis]
MSNANESRRSTAEALGENPLALVAGGVALGVLIGVLLPRARKEREVLKPVGKKIAGTATAAAKRAKEVGKAEVEALLPDRDATRDRVTKLIDSVLEAAKGASAKAD